MFCRCFAARALLPTYQLMRNVAAQGSMRISNFASQYISCKKLETSVFRRFYSDKVEAEPMTTDYKYVKEAIYNTKTLIIDVREPDEVRENGKIPNSINIPLGSVPTVLSEMSENEFLKTFSKPKPLDNTEIIFYCMVGKRSAKAQQSAISAGYKNTKNYLGSWTDWASRQLQGQSKIE